MSPAPEVRTIPAALTDRAIAWRHELHRHPELLFDVHWTSDFVAARLAEFGCDEVARGIGRTGVVGVIRGRTDISGRVLGLRADMDALPITELADVDYRSKRPGLMHACGHDGHMAMLLGAACHLAVSRDFDGTLIVIFQPAEEGGGGARVMIEDGLVARFGIQNVFGLHIMPGIPCGHIATRQGVIMASSDRFDCTITGQGAHAAMPELGVDPILAACNAVVALQSIASRNVDPKSPVVLSVTGIESGAAYNVIPATASFRGSVRTTLPEVRDLVERRIEEIVTGIAASFGASAELDYKRGYPNTINHPEPTRRSVEAAIAAVGAAQVNPETPLLMGSEDFSFMLEAVPGSFAFLGNGASAGLHNPRFVFDDAAIPAGIAYWLALAAQPPARASQAG